jgi:hypothetical protein
MATIFVQFSDSTEKTVISAFSCPQDPSAWPNQGEIDSSDERWSAYYRTIPAGPARDAWPAPTS